MSEISCGYIYIMTSDAMPGMVYIGRCGPLGAHDMHGDGLNVSDRDPRRWPGFPGVFLVQLEAWTCKSTQAMQDIEIDLIRHRVGRASHFFRVSFAEAAAAVLTATTKEQFEA